MADAVRWKRGAILAVTGTVLCLAVVGAFLLGSRGGRAPEPPALPIARTLQPAAVAVEAGIYYLGKLNPGAAYAIDTSAGIVLIDTGLEADAALVKSQFAELRLDHTRLKAIFLTHGHADHSLGAARLKAETGAPIHAGRGDAGFLREGGPREAFFSTFHMPDRSAHATAVDVELAGGERFDFGDARIEAIATPGHTRGSVCYAVERGGLRALVTGDVVQGLNLFDRRSFGTYAAYLPPRFGGDARAYLDSLRRLRELPPPDLVLPGHPRTDVSPPNPRVTAQRWQALLDRGIEEMKRLVARFDADGADFLDGTPREILPDLHYLGDAGNIAVYALRMEKGIMVINAPAGIDIPQAVRHAFKGSATGAPAVIAVLLPLGEGPAVAGLNALAAATGCTVVVPRAARESVQRLCPPETKILAAEEAAAEIWMELRSIALAGRGPGQAGFEFRWHDRTVLATGTIPMKMTAEGFQELVADLGGDPARGAALKQSLEQLAARKPDVWLPARPVQGQNANLYDDDWKNTIERNGQLFR